MCVLTALRASRSSGIIVAGPRMQFNPTTSAPASAIRLQASAIVQFSRVTSAWCIASVITAVLFARLITSRAINASCAHEKVSPMT